MRQIQRLQIRLKNLNRNSTEFRMSVEEAKELLKEIELLQQQLAEKPTTVVQVVEKKSETFPRILDGGTLG